MDLSNLNAPRPVPPNLNYPQDNKVQIILRDLEKIKTSKKRKRLKKSEHLVYFIAHSLRKSMDDYLLHTTAVWVLIVLFRMFPTELKTIMLEAGIPGVLHSVIQVGGLSGSSRHSNHIYEPNSKEGGPMTKFPEIQAFNRYQADLDDVSIISDVSSQDDRPWRKPFIPYRIDASNMNKMDSLFEKGYASQLAATLPSVGIMSKYGFSQQGDENEMFESTYQNLEGYQNPEGFLEKLHEQDEDDDGDDNEGSASSSESFGDRSEDESKLTQSDTGSNMSFNSYNNHPYNPEVQKRSAPISKKRQLFPTIRDEITRRNSFVMNYQDDNVSISSLSTKRKFHGENGMWKTDQVTSRPRTSSAIVEQRQLQHLVSAAGASYPQQTKEFSKTLPSPFRLGKLAEAQNLRNNNNFEDDENSSLGYSSQTGSLISSQGSSAQGGNGIFATQSLDRLPLVASAPHRMVQQLKNDPNRASTAGNIFDTRKPHSSQQRHRTSHSQSSSRRPNTQGSYLTSSPTKQESYQNTFFGLPERATAQTPIDIYKNKKFSHSLQLQQQYNDQTLIKAQNSLTHQQLQSTNLQQSNSFVSSSLDQLLSEIDPFAVPGRSAPSFATDSPNRAATSRSFTTKLRVNIRPGSLRTNHEEDDEIASDVDENENKKRKLQEDLELAKEEDGLGDLRQAGGDDISYDDWDSSDDEMENYYTNLVESEIEQEAERTNNPFIKIKRMRIRAEKLIDNKFIHALFVKKMTIQDTQDLISRMENIIYLLDPQETGYITFEQFMKIILGVAPKHLLKQNIIKFFEYQTDNMSNLIDYQEFLISGKVLILTELQKKAYENFKKKVNSNSLTMSPNQRQLMTDTKEIFAYRNEKETFTKSWLGRQKKYINDPSTLTWKNHLKWYSSRKSQVIIWLIRRGKRALEYEIKLKKAYEYLSKIRFKAFAITDLMALGADTLLAQKQREEAKKHLLLRVRHARNFIRKVKNAYEYLQFVGLGAIKDTEYYEKHYGEKEDPKEAGVDGIDRGPVRQNTMKMKLKLAEIQKQKLQAILQKKVNYGNLWKVNELRKFAIKSLREKGVKAINHCAKQDEAFAFLLDLSKRTLLHQFKKEKVRRELVMIAERALEFSLLQDQTLLGLLRIGAQKKIWLNNQIDSLAWLIERGQTTKEFVAKKYSKGYELISKARQILNFMNSREDAFAYLSQRCLKSQQFIKKKQEAIEYLRERPKGLWAIFDKQIQIQETLAETGRRALAHMTRKRKAANFLQYIASRAVAQHRKSQIAYQELCQIGMVARYEAFKQMIYAKANQRLYKYYLKEKQLILKNDVRIMKNYQNYFQNKMKMKMKIIQQEELKQQQQQSQHPQQQTPLRPRTGFGIIPVPIKEDPLAEAGGDDSEDHRHDYSAKVMTIDTLSAKLNGIQDQSMTRGGTRSRSASPSRKLLNNNNSSMFSSISELGGDQPLNEDTPQLALENGGEEKMKEEGEETELGETFNLTQVDRQAGERSSFSANGFDETTSPAFENESPFPQGDFAQDFNPETNNYTTANEENNNNNNVNNEQQIVMFNDQQQVSLDQTNFRSRPVSSSAPSRPTSVRSTRSTVFSKIRAEEIEPPFTIMVQNIVKLEFIECFQLLSSIYTPAHVLLKNHLEQLELVLPNIEDMKRQVQLEAEEKKKQKKNKKLGGIEKSHASANNTAIMSNSQELVSHQPTPTIMTAPESPTNHPTSINKLPSQVIMTTATDTSGTNAQYDIIGKYGFLRLMNNGKFLQITEFEAKEVFRNLDINTSCYVNISNIYFYVWGQLKKKHKLIKYLLSDPTNTKEKEKNKNKRPGTSGGPQSSQLLLTNNSRPVSSNASSRPASSATAGRTLPSSSPLMNNLRKSNINPTDTSVHENENADVAAETGESQGDNAEVDVNPGDGNMNNNTTRLTVNNQAVVPASANNSRPSTGAALLRTLSSAFTGNKDSTTPLIALYTQQLSKSLPTNRIIMNDIIAPEERAIMILYKRMLRDDAFYNSLLEVDVNKKKFSAYDEYRAKMQQIKDDEDDSDEDEDYNYGDEEEDEDLLFSDLEKLKKMDVGRLMKYLTKKRIAKQELLEQQQALENGQPQPVPPASAGQPVTSDPPVEGMQSMTISKPEHEIVKENIKV